VLLPGETGMQLYTETIGWQGERRPNELVVTRRRVGNSSLYTPFFLEAGRILLFYNPACRLSRRICKMAVEQRQSKIKQIARDASASPFDTRLIRKVMREDISRRGRALPLQVAVVKYRRRCASCPCWRGRCKSDPGAPTR